MADISKLNVNKTDYNIKDASAISGLSASGKTITYTKRDGTTGTITTQDTNTTYSAGTGISLSGTTFSVDNSGVSPYEANLQWGGKNFSGSYGAIDASMIPSLGANRLEFLKADGIKIEYSRDGGSTWTDYGSSNYNKTALFSNVGAGHGIGKNDSTYKATANTNKYKLRITVTTNTAGIYTVLNKFAIYLSTNGSSECTCTIDVRTKANVDAGANTWLVVANKVPVSGWSGWNIINTTGITTYGNTTAQYANVRFLFEANGGNTNYTGLSVSKILGFGGVGWAVPSTMAGTGHLYSYDADQNATFPSNVTATKFSGGVADSGNGTATTFAYSKAGLTSTSWLAGWNGYELRAIAPANITAGNASKVNNLTVETAVPANAKFTDTTYSVATTSANGLMSSADKTKLNGIATGATANTGTVTSVAVKMNNSTKGTVTSSGTIDLGTVLTSHQDISGKQDKTTAVTHTASTAVGSATNPVYIASNGVATATTYTLGKSVPSDAKFTDTTYSVATTSANGLMSSTDKTKLDGIATGANKYSLPNATSSTLGGVKVGSNISVSSGTISLTKSNVTTALGYTPPNAIKYIEKTLTTDADGDAGLNMGNTPVIVVGIKAIRYVSESYSSFYIAIAVENTNSSGDSYWYIKCIKDNMTNLGNTKITVGIYYIEK